MISDGSPRVSVQGLNQMLESVGLQPLASDVESKFNDYVDLILRWNARMNLTAVRDPRQIQARHFVESIACARNLPADIGSLLDLGSGAGFPGVPIALCRPEIRVTLAESQTKKASFLMEVVRVLKLSSKVFSQRAENLVEEFDCVALRAVDNMSRAVATASRLVRPGGVLAIMTTTSEVDQVMKMAAKNYSSPEVHPLPSADKRVLLTAFKSDSSI